MSAAVRLHNHSARQNMIDGLLAPNGVRCERVIAAIGVVERSHFVPASHAQCAYLDAPVPLAAGRSLLSVLALARLVQALELQEHEKLLIIGGNLGYSAAICAHLGADIYMLEDVPAWVLAAKSALAALNVGHVSVVQNSLATGLLAHAPFDAILIDGAIEHLPDAIISQLKEAGRLATIEKHTALPHVTAGIGDMVLYRKQTDGLVRSSFGQAASETLTGFKRPETFSLL